MGIIYLYPLPKIAISPKTSIVDWILKSLPSPQKTSLEPNDWLVTSSHTMLYYPILLLKDNYSS